jgi:hypothetical protein
MQLTSISGAPGSLTLDHNNATVRVSDASGLLGSLNTTAASCLSAVACNSDREAAARRQARQACDGEVAASKEELQEALEQVAVKTEDVGRVLAQLEHVR